MDFDYKNYSLSKLNEWVNDAITCSEASPQEVYDTIKKVVQENFDSYQKTAEKCRELLNLMNGHRPIEFNLSDYGTSYSDTMSGIGNTDDYIHFNVDSERNQFDFYGVGITEGYESSMPPWGHSDLEYGITNDFLTQDRNSNFPGENTLNDKVVKWQLPVEEDGLSGEYFVTFPDDLLEAANLIPNDLVEWVDRGDGSYLLKKVENPTDENLKD
jgi:hypothetical protein